MAEMPPFCSRIELVQLRPFVAAGLLREGLYLISDHYFRGLEGTTLIGVHLAKGPTTRRPPPVARGI